jgi:elongation factor 2
MGELHLEIIENRIRTEKNVEIRTSSPIVVYREAISKLSQEVEGKSPNKHNKFYFIVEPMPEIMKNALKEGRINEGRVKKKNLEFRKQLMDAGMELKEADSVKNVYNGNILMDMTKGQVHMIEVIELILDTFEDVMENGPLAREPCINVLVKLVDMKLHEDAIHRGPAQVYPAVREGIRGAMMTASPVLYEPIQTHLIECPTEYMGEVTKLVSSKRGQLIDMQEAGMQTTITARLPVMEMIGWASDLRSATAGRGVSSLIDQTFERLPGEIQDKVVRQIRDRKGLSESQVGI